MGRGGGRGGVPVHHSSGIQPSRCSPQQRVEGRSAPRAGSLSFPPRDRSPAADLCFGHGVPAGRPSCRVPHRPNRRALASRPIPLARRWRAVRGAFCHQNGRFSIPIWTPICFRGHSFLHQPRAKDAMAPKEQTQIIEMPDVHPPIYSVVIPERRERVRIAPGGGWLGLPGGPPGGGTAFRCRPQDRCGPGRPLPPQPHDPIRMSSPFLDKFIQPSELSPHLCQHRWRGMPAQGSRT